MVGGVVTAVAVGDAEMEDADWTYDRVVTKAAECDEVAPPEGTGHDQVLGAEATVPTTVNAGLLVAGGALLLLLAGLLQLGRREPGAHEA